MFLNKLFVSHLATNLPTSHATRGHNASQKPGLYAATKITRHTSPISIFNIITDIYTQNCQVHTFLRNLRPKLCTHFTSPLRVLRDVPIELQESELWNSSLSNLFRILIFLTVNATHSSWQTKQNHYAYRQVPIPDEDNYYSNFFTIVWVCH